jgi:hypothetical protein
MTRATQMRTSSNFTVVIPVAGSDASNLFSSVHALFSAHQVLNLFDFDNVRTLRS